MDNRKIFDLAEQYLLSFPIITPETLEEQCTFPTKAIPKSINELFRRLIIHSYNRQGMKNSIGEVEVYRDVLFDFDPKNVLSFYKSWEELFNTIQTKCTPPGRMVKNNPHSFLVIFCKSILSIAKYLKRFESIESFNVYVSKFISSDILDIRLGLPLLMKEEIFGYKFALACDFIKENISPDFIKPDTHIKYIFIQLGMSLPDANDFEIFKNVIEFSKSINESPYKVDKTFWLIGTGNFYNKKIKIDTSRDKFLNLIMKTQH
jgi:hypothetical protein